MAADDWNFIAGRLTGDGGIDIIETELPIEIETITRQLSAPTMMEGSITNAVKRLKNNGKPVFQPWNTVLISMASDVIRGMTIYRRPSFSGPVWSLDQIGFGGYPMEMPYDGDATFINADPLDIFRHIWDHLQGKTYGNLGVTIDPTTSPIRVGSAKTDDPESGPRTLNWWSTLNLGTEIDNYATETPFDWVEQFSWGVGNQPHCHLGLGYPQIGGIKDQLRLVYGENLAEVPGVAPDEYANGWYVLGAGEGRERVRGYAGVADGQLRRVGATEDKAIASVARANVVAAQKLKRTRGHLEISNLQVYDHPNAPLEAIELGDTLPLYAELDHITVDQRVRVVAKSESPQRQHWATLSVIGVEQP